MLASVIGSGGMRARERPEGHDTWPLEGAGGRRYTIRFRYRRLGIDNGFDTLVHLDANVRTALDRFDDVMKPPRK
jgi:hypothetical protein